MSLLPILSESQGAGYSASLNVIKYVQLRENKERMGMVHSLLDFKSLSINELSHHLQKLVNRFLASGAMLVLIAEYDLPIISIGDVKKLEFTDGIDENRLLTGRILNYKDSICYPIVIGKYVLGYVKLDVPGWQRNDYFNDVAAAYVDIINRELALDIKSSRIKKEKVQLEQKKVQFRHWQQRSRKLLNMITHDLKSPLLAVSGYLNLLGTKLKMGYNDPRVNQYFEKIETGLSDMSEVVGQINDLLVYVNDRISITKVEVELNWLVKEVLELMEPLAHSKKISLSYSPSYEPVFVEVDIIKTKRIVYNLVSNSIKYTPAEGNIEVMISTSENEILLLVKDDGYGISQEKMDAIFQSYHRGLENDEAEWCSSGLGLAISNMFAHILGGRISVESKPGIGSTFKFHLPLIAD